MKKILTLLIFFLITSVCLAQRPVRVSATQYRGQTGADPSVFESSNSNNATIYWNYGTQKWRVFDGTSWSDLQAATPDLDAVATVGATTDITLKVESGLLYSDVNYLYFKSFDGINGDEARFNYDGIYFSDNLGTGDLTINRSITTGNHTQTFQDASGDIALTSQLFTWDYDYGDLINTPTIPDNTDYVDLTTAQSVGGAKTFTFGSLYVDANLGKLGSYSDDIFQIYETSTGKGITGNINTAVQLGLTDDDVDTAGQTHTVKLSGFTFVDDYNNTSTVYNLNYPNEVNATVTLPSGTGEIPLKSDINLDVADENNITQFTVEQDEKLEFEGVTFDAINNRVIVADPTDGFLINTVIKGIVSATPNAYQIDSGDTEAQQRADFLVWLVDTDNGSLTQQEMDERIKNWTVSGSDLSYTAVADYRLANSFGKLTSGCADCTEFHDYDGHIDELQFQQFSGNTNVTHLTFNGINYLSGGSQYPGSTNLEYIRADKLTILSSGGFNGFTSLDDVVFPKLKTISAGNMFKNTGIDNDDVALWTELETLSSQYCFQGTSVTSVNFPKLHTLNQGIRASSIRNVRMPNLRYSLAGADFFSMSETGTQTSGTLVVGFEYELTTFVAGDDFTNVGAPSNTSGVRFIASATTPTTWTNSSTISNKLWKLDFPELEYIGGVAQYMFAENTIEYINAPKLRQIGVSGASTNDGAFDNVHPDCVINVNYELATNNSGGLDQNLIDAIDNEGATINFFENGKKVQEVGSMGFEENTTATSIATQDVYVKVAGTTADNISKLFTHTTGRLTYDGGDDKNFHISADLSMTSVSSNQTITFKLHKNGSPIGYEIRRFVGTGTDVGAVTIDYDVELDRTDYIELFVKNETSTGNVTVESLYLSIEEH